MKLFTNLLFVMCIYHHRIGEAASWYKLLNGMGREVGTHCSNEWNGNITIFQDYSSRELRQILDENDQVMIWNGYRYTSDWVENTGCFNNTVLVTEYRTKMADMTIAYCQHICKELGEFDIAIKESECLCVRDIDITTFFKKSNAHFCTNKCNMRPDEYCGSTLNSTFYNIYSVREPKSHGYPSITGNGSCILYKRIYPYEKLKATNCDEELTSGFIACRSIYNFPIRINSPILTWKDSFKACLQSSRSKSYLVSYSDVNNIAYPDGTIWLNDRKYTTTVEDMNNQENLEICEVLSRGSDGNAVPEFQNCNDDSDVQYVCQIGNGSSYVLLNGTRRRVWNRCRNRLHGHITIFRNYSSIVLSEILDGDDEIEIWNGYKYTSDWVENTGCFNKTTPLARYSNRTTDMTIAYCERFCKEYGEFEFAIKESECICITGLNNYSAFNKSSSQHCTNKCNKRPYEYCGSKMSSTFYNLYSVRVTKSLGYPAITGIGFCLLYEKKYNNEELKATNCDTDLTTGMIACRSVHNFPIRLNSPILTWTESLKACLENSRSKSYLVSYSDIKNIMFQNGTVWLNERKYTTTLEKINNQETLEICEVLSRGPNGNVTTKLRSCSNDSGIRYVCKTGDVVNELSTSTAPHQHDSTYSRISPESQEENGSLIGGVIGALVLVAIIGGVIVVFVMRMRHTGSCKEESQYQSQNVNYSKSNGIANVAYCSEATFDIIQGNPDRNSQENYMTIKDEDLQSLRNGKSEATKSADQSTSSPSDGPLYMVLGETADQSTSSPSDGPLYMVLEETNSLSEVAASFPNYELAKPVPNNESGGKENCENNEENVEYDHLRQDAYKQAQEDAHQPADIADDYSHISQVTSVNDDNYTHTENYMHTCTTTNEEDDAYAHAQNTDNDYMVSEGDTRNIDPYDIAQDVHNLQNDSTECKTDTFVQLDADNGNYSLAKPVDVSNGTQNG